MAKITIEELSDSLKEYLSGLGLTEEQVNSLVQNKLGDLSNLETVNKDNIVNSVNEVKDTVAFVGTAIFGSDMSDDTLMTDSNTVIGAINELFQSANSGKELIANAIGEPLSSEDTFSAMSDKINEIKDDLKQILTDEDVSVTEEDDIASLIIKVDEEFAKDNNTINSLNTEKTNLTNQVNTLNSNIENTRSTLAGLMQEGGYNITGDEDINSLLDLLIINDISLDNIKQIVCGGLHTFILKNDGSLWAAGFNKYGQLGLNSTVDKTTFTQVTTSISDIKQIACGYYHTFILKNDGSVWACGYNNYGQLGLGNTTTYKTFTQVANINDVKQIACGDSHTFILKNDGSLWACGYNNYGQLGLNDTTNRTTFTQVAINVKQVVCGKYHTFIIKNDGSLWACGYNNKGQLGLGDTTNRSTFTQVATDVKQVVCGSSHTFILKNNGSVYSCGYNYSGQLGLGDNTDRTTFTQVTTNINDVKQIACGGSHTFILKNDGSLWAAGDNYNGQLGLGTSDNNVHGTFTQITTNINNDVKQIACGLDVHTIILKNDNSIWGTGRNDRGQLGLSNTSEKTAFTIVPKGFTY